MARFIQINIYLYNIKMNVYENKAIVTPIVTEHWKNKFDKAVRVLLKSGYKSEELIEKIKDITNSESAKQN